MDIKIPITIQDPPTVLIEELPFGGPPRRSETPGMEHESTITLHIDDDLKKQLIDLFKEQA